MHRAVAGVPGIDISKLHTRKHELSQQLLQAAEGVGFFYVTGMTAGKRPAIVGTAN